MQSLISSGRGPHRGKTSFVEHRTILHLYHSFHRLWIFLFLMFQVWDFKYSYAVLLLAHVLCIYEYNFITCDDYMYWESIAFCFMAFSACQFSTACHATWHSTSLDSYLSPFARYVVDKTSGCPFFSFTKSELCFFFPACFNGYCWV